MSQEISYLHASHTSKRMINDCSYFPSLIDSSFISNNHGMREDELSKSGSQLGDFITNSTLDVCICEMIQ